MSKNRQPPSSSNFFDDFSVPVADPSVSKIPVSIEKRPPSETAIVYCEDNFGGIDGKTANGLVRHSEKYQILSVIDGGKAGRDAGSGDHVIDASHPQSDAKPGGQG